MGDKKDYAESITTKPLKDNQAIFLVWGGVFLVFIGSIFGDNIDGITYIPNGTGKALLSSGAAILGAGVFTIIMKSGQFTEVFRKHIFDVMYSPAMLEDQNLLKEKWSFLTNEMLKHVLPKAHSDATKHIEKQFLNAELEYHFENHEMTYEITVHPNGDDMTIKNTTRSTIVLSPKIENPIFEQKFWSNGESRLCKLFIHDQNINKADMFVQDENDSTLKVLTFPFKEYGIISNTKEDKKVSFERIIENTQKLSDDPILLSTINRYAKGFVVKAKISDGYKLIFDSFGYNDVSGSKYTVNDGDGFHRWQLAEPDELLLPGDGYVISITKVI